MPPAGAVLAPLSSARPSGDRVSELSTAAGRAERLAARIEDACRESEAVMEELVVARDREQLAWLILCDRGWPSTERAVPANLAAARHWMAIWADVVALPARMRTPGAVLRQVRLRRELATCEPGVALVLPAPAWELVTPLDAIGRATLACLLQALEVWVAAREFALGVERRKQRQVALLSLLAELAHSLGLHVPEAPLDLDGWRAVAGEARVIVATEGRGAAA
jgi:hypothetical protein